MALSAASLIAQASAPVATAQIVSSAFTPTAGAFLWVWVPNTGSTAANGQGTINSSHSGAGALTWTVGGVTGGGNTTGGGRWWYCKQVPASPTNGTVTVNLPGTPTIQDLRVYQLTGQDPVNPVYGRPSAAITGTTATSLSGNLSAAPATDDLTVAMVVNRNKATAPTVGTGFTSLDPVAGATPSASFLVQTRTGSTSTAVGAGNVGTTWSGLEAFVVKAATTTPKAGSASGALALVGTATGRRVTAGLAAGALLLAGTAAGTTQRRGSTTGSLQLAGTAAGTSVHRGAATGALALTGSASGTSPRRGAAAGVITLTGTTSGATPRRGASAGTLVLAGTTVGVTVRRGVASGVLDLPGTADGAAPVVGGRAGSATGDVVLDGTATGSTARRGLASGSLAWVGTAEGHAPTGPALPPAHLAGGELVTPGVTSAPRIAAVTAAPLRTATLTGDLR